MTILEQHGGRTSATLCVPCLSKAINLELSSETPLSNNQSIEHTKIEDEDEEEARVTERTARLLLDLAQKRHCSA